MYRIGVLSDTHLPDNGESLDFLTSLADTYFADVDMILHAGDVVSPSLLDHFSTCPVYAVRGNMDPGVAGIPFKRVVTVGRFRVGLIHGWGSSQGLEHRVLSEFSGYKLDALVFGHSHRPICQQQGGVLMFNPGSATDRRRMERHSVGLLEIDTQVNGRIIFID